MTHTGKEYRDLSEVLDYREYPGEWDSYFEQRWLRPRLEALGYRRVRFFGGRVSPYDSTFLERVCEVAVSDAANPEYFVYG